MFCLIDIIFVNIYIFMKRFRLKRRDFAPLRARRQKYRPGRLLGLSDYGEQVAKLNAQREGCTRT